MYRVISFFVLFSFVSLMLYLHNLSGHSGTMNHALAHQTNQILIPDNVTAPSITGSVSKDLSGTWLLEIETNHFTFEPEKVGTQDISYNEGHAHIYLDGIKVNRLYGNYYNLDNLSPGKHEIKVTLNGNNHGVFVLAGKEIAYTETIEVP
ncbi:hypothetical protein ACLM5H_03075 [Fredinandcohnia humi]